MNKYIYIESECVYVYVCVYVCFCVCFHIERESSIDINNSRWTLSFIPCWGICPRWQPWCHPWRALYAWWRGHMEFTIERGAIIQYNMILKIKSWILSYIINLCSRANLKICLFQIKTLKNGNWIFLQLDHWVKFFLALILLCGQYNF